MYRWLRMVSITVCIQMVPLYADVPVWLKKSKNQYGIGSFVTSEFVYVAVYKGVSKGQRDKVLVPIKIAHRTADMIAPQYLDGKNIDRNKVGARIAAIAVDECCWYEVKNRVRGQYTILGTEHIKISTAALLGIVRKMVHKSVDTGITCGADVNRIGYATVHAGLTETAYIALTQLVHAVPWSDDVRAYVTEVLPQDGYPRTTGQRWFKLIWSKCAAMFRS